MRGLYLIIVMLHGLFHIETWASGVANSISNEQSIFRFHIQSDPDSLDPIQSSYSISSYVLNSLYTPLMQYQKNKLQGYGAQQCKIISPTHYRCLLRKDWRWSDGTSVLAQQFVDGFRAMKEEKSPRMDHFLNLKSVTSRGSRQIDFYLQSADADFLYRLIDPALSPRRSDLNMGSGKTTTGPYFLKSRTPGRSLSLKRNPYFFHSASFANASASDAYKSEAPEIEVLIVDSDDTALRLYQTGKLNFLRRLTTENVLQYKNSKELFHISLHRFDYIGFGPQLEEYPDLREKLIYSLQPQYDRFIKIFSAIGRPGCLGLSSTIVDRSFCYGRRDVKPYSESDISALPSLYLNYALQGGEDIRRAMEFFQSGWKTNLNLKIELRPTEHGLLTQTLKTSPPPLFRRGVPLDRPTCLSALEIFSAKSPDNFIRFNDTQYEKNLRELRQARSPHAYKKFCFKGLQQLLDAHRIIPLGEIHFAMLTDHKFDSFFINELNQLDVSRLTRRVISQEPKTKVR